MATRFSGFASLGVGCGHRNGINCVNSQYLQPFICATGSQDATVRLWDLRCVPFRANKCFSRMFSDEITSIAFDHSHTMYAASGSEIFQLDTRQEQIVCTIPQNKLELSGEEINCIDIHPYGVLLAVDDGGCVNGKSIPETQDLFSVPHAHNNISYAAKFSPDSDYCLNFATGGLDGSLIGWQFHPRDITPSPVFQVDFTHAIHQAEGHQSKGINPPFVYSLDYTSDAELLGCGLGDGSIVLLEPSTGEILLRLCGHGSITTSFQFLTSLDNPYVAILSAGTDMDVNLWSVPSEIIVDTEEAESDENKGHILDLAQLSLESSQSEEKELVQSEITQNSGQWYHFISFSFFLRGFINCSIHKFCIGRKFSPQHPSF